MIKYATLGNIFELEKIIEQAAQEGDYKNTNYNRERVLLALYNTIIDDNQCVITYSRDDKIVGIYIGYLTNWQFSDDLVAQDITWYVLPKFRKGRASIALIKEFEHWAHNKGAKSICPGSMTGGNIDYVRKLYEKLGYTTIGFNFRKDY